METEPDSLYSLMKIGSDSLEFEVVLWYLCGRDIETVRPSQYNCVIWRLFHTSPVALWVAGFVLPNLGAAVGHPSTVG